MLKNFCLKSRTAWFPFVFFTKARKHNGQFQHAFAISYYYNHAESIDSTISRSLLIKCTSFALVFRY